MITNGYLLTKDPDVVQKLKDSRIKFFQITLDGPPDVHNSRRMLKGDSGPTFDQVLEGIKLLTANELAVSLRVNVDRSNMDGALKLLDILEENNLKDIAIHLGHVSADTAGCKSIESSCTTMEEFNVDYVGKTKDALKIENDKMDNDSFYNFLFDVYSRMYEVALKIVVKLVIWYLIALAVAEAH